MVLLVSFSLASTMEVLAQSWGQFKQAATSAVEAGNMSEAEKFWTSALELSADNGSRDPRFCSSVQGLASVYRSREKFAEAEALYKKVVPAPATFAPGCDELNSCATDYADFLKQQKRKDEADLIVARLASVATPARSANSPAPVLQPVARGPASGAVESASSKPSGDANKWAEYTSLGRLQFRQKNFSAAEQSFNTALSQISVFPQSDPRLNQTFVNLTDTFESEGKIAEADLAHHGTLRWIKKYRGNLNTDYIAALVRHGKLLRRLNRKTEAMAEEGKAEKLQYAIAGGPNEGDPFQAITSIGESGSIIGGMSFATGSGAGGSGFGNSYAPGGGGG